MHGSCTSYINNSSNNKFIVVDGRSLVSLIKVIQVWTVKCLWNLCPFNIKIYIKIYLKFKLSKFTWVVSGHTSTLNKSPLWWKVKAKKVQRNISGATLDEERRRRSSGSGVATRKVEVTVGIWVFFFFFSLVYNYTLYRSIFNFQPISGIFPGTAGTSRYDPVFEAERNSHISVPA